MVDKSKQLIILMYHSLRSRDTSEALLLGEDPVYLLEREKFSSQIKYLADAKIKVIDGNNLNTPNNACPEPIKEGGVLITFDDGHISNYTVGFPIMYELGFRAVFFITTDWIGCKRFLTREMIRELHSLGMKIGSHGQTHKFLTELNDQELKLELKYSKERLEEIVGSEIDFLSVPGGRINQRVRDTAFETGYSAIFTSKPIVNYNTTKREYGRFPIKSRLNWNNYVKIVHGRPSPLHSIMYIATSNLRFLLGDTRYSKARDYVSTLFDL